MNASGDRDSHAAVEPAATAPTAAPPGAAASGLAGPLSASLMSAPASRRGAEPLRRAAALQLQCSHGNAALSGWLARKGKLPSDNLIRGRGSAMIVGEDVSGDLYDAPDDTRPPVGKLKADGVATLIGTAGAYYIVEVDGTRAYIKQSGIATAIDTPGAGTKADWDSKLKAAHDKVNAAGNAGGPAQTSGGGVAAVSSGPNKALSPEFMALQLKLSSLNTWNQDMEDAATLLRDYALWYFTSYHATPLPGNLKVYFDYIGRSSRNNAAAEAMKVKSTRHLGGFLDEKGKGSVDWCTQATTTAVKDALKDKGWTTSDAANYAKITQMAAKTGNTVSAPAAYTAPLYPGDMVMYLFAGCQHGGHTVTVIDDLGDSFTHISGNATNAGVLIGEKRRMTKEPAGFSLAKATPGPVRDENKEIDKEATKKAFADSNQYLRGFDSAFGDAALIYSIIRYGTVLNTLPANPPPGAKQP